MAATFNPDRARDQGKGMGRDTRARGYYSILGPGLNFYRLPLGGRNFEYMTGEDPLLGSKLVVPYVRGIQAQGVWACAKHYVGNEQEYKRSTIDIQVDERVLREIYLPPFEASVRQGDVALVMGAYNKVNGEWACESSFLLEEVLKGDWGFDGPVISDYNAIHDGLRAAQGGCDLDLPRGEFMTPDVLRNGLNTGALTVEDIDEKVRRLLRKIIEFGFLDRPQQDPTIPRDDPASGLASLNIAREGLVLLKNEQNLLPLKKRQMRSIAVMGPFARGIPPTGFGSSYVTVLTFISELSGIQHVAGRNVRVNFVETGTVDPSTSAWESLDQNGFVQDGLIGQYYDSNDFSGDPVTRLDRRVNFDWTRPGTIPGLEQRNFSARWTGRFRPAVTGESLFKVRADGGVKLVVGGQTLINTLSTTPVGSFFMPTSPLYAKASFQAGQTYNVQLEYRRVDGFTGSDGALQGVQFGWVSFEVPPDLASYDAVILTHGIDSEFEGENVDRPFALPGFGSQLIQKTAAANRRTVVVLHGGGGLETEPWIDRVPALIHAWYPGQFGGLALGEILFGDVNPSGKLPITLERRQEDNPAFATYPTDNTATAIPYSEGLFVGYRGYEKNGIQPLFPFGHGLSYTRFRYSDVKVRPQVWAGDRQVEVTFTVTNAGKQAGAEAAQVYLGKRNSRVDRPLKELKGFAKAFLEPGKSKRVTVKLNRRSFSYYNTDEQAWDTEPGLYDVSVGASSQDIRLRAQVVNLLTGPFWQLAYDTSAEMDLP